MTTWPVRVAGVVAFAAIAAMATPDARAETFTIRLATGHPPGQHYVELFQRYMAPQLKARVAARTKHQVNVLELYSGSAIKLPETIEALSKGIVDIAGGCYCFHPSELPLHSFQIGLPFGTSDPILSLNIARDVYGVTPELSDIFEQKHNQKQISLLTLDPYEIDSRKPINTLADLQGMKIGGAGPNLPWVAGAGAIPVQTTATIVYNSLQTGVYDGVIGYISLTHSLKLHEMAPYHTKVGFGSMVWIYVHAGQDFLKKLPPEVRDIVLEVGRDFEEVLAVETAKRYDARVEELVKAGMKLTDLDPKVRQQWAESLKDWPNQRAKDVDKLGWPGSKTAKLTLDTAEKHGYKWPVRYVIE
ncbi:MAG: C4-dicarboxylate TRAP transporter substrate-binding protein [Alphaproteobacteria bacterium]